MFIYLIFNVLFTFKGRLIIYKMITKNEEYNEQKNEMNRNNLREKQLAKAIKMLKNNNFHVVDFEGVVV